MYKNLPQILKNKKYDLIIVGSGPAGLAILDSLKDSSKSILVLEAGFKSFEEISQEIYNGETSGFPHGDIYLWRKRQLGGSSNCWGGGIIPFDEIDFLIEPRFKKYCIEKGSIAIDGVSLTIASINDLGVKVALIPHTLSNTILSGYKLKQKVNIETDMVGKFIENFSGMVN